MDSKTLIKRITTGGLALTAGRTLTMLYPAFVELGDKNHAYGVVLPDFPGCFSAADEMNDLPARVQEAVELYFEGEDLPLPPSDLATLRTRPEFAYDGLWMLFDIDTSRLTTRAKRFNATLPANLLAAIDDYVKTHGGSRSGFLAEAAREKLRSH